ncbi:hypothetical protein Bpfe_001902 [Biomphalaria pfeifferi]|uniref:PID domain-containing protein n=1 Tax=Biomphalaria pfeifferi TaxID=112525 RepID=A0AAD8C9V6_BIOPF|nr:hypothetical protein Bpfe_001902 [Biomphalaria pfeifferi]
MSFFSGGRNREKDTGGAASQFYVEFLGWMECRGVRGANYTDPVIRELKQRQKHVIKPPKLTIQVSKSDLKITQEVDDGKKKGIKKIKFPTIPARDITYVKQGRHSDGRLDDVVACIYLGYMPRTQKFVHVHVYRFDEAATATTFAQQLSGIVEANYNHVLEVEADLINKGEVEDNRIYSPSIDLNADDSAVGSSSSAFSDDEPPSFRSDIDPDLQSLKDVLPFDNVAEELKFRLQLGDAPLLLPPKDYDTISRAHGKLDKVKERRCLNVQIVGQNAITEVDENRARLGSMESGVDTASPGSDSTEKKENVHKTTSSSTSPGISPREERRSLKDKKASSLNTNHMKLDLNSKNSQHSGSISPVSPPVSAKDFVYPPKKKSPPTSPRLYRSEVPKEKLVKQSSINSYLNDVARPQDNVFREEKPTHYFPNSSSEDIYAMPAKRSPSKSSSNPLPPEVELPPDYDDDVVFNNNINGSKFSKTEPVNHKVRLKRNASEDYPRHEFLSSSGRPADIRRNDPYAAARPSHQANDKSNAPRFGRVNSTKK